MACHKKVRATSSSSPVTSRTYFLTVQERCGLVVDACGRHRHVPLLTTLTSTFWRTSLYLDLSSELCNPLRGQIQRTTSTCSILSYRTSQDRSCGNGQHDFDLQAIQRSIGAYIESESPCYLRYSYSLTSRARFPMGQERCVHTVRLPSRCRSSDRHGLP